MWSYDILPLPECETKLVANDSPVQFVGVRHNDATMEPQDLQDHELKAQAHEWRTRALRGDKKARGIAHELEREVRRRFSTPANDTIYDGLDLRPLEQRQEEARRPPWKFW